MAFAGWTYKGHKQDMEGSVSVLPLHAQFTDTGAVSQAIQRDEPGPSLGRGRYGGPAALSAYRHGREEQSAFVVTFGRACTDTQG